MDLHLKAYIVLASSRMNRLTHPRNSAPERIQMSYIYKMNHGPY